MDNVLTPKNIITPEVKQKQSTTSSFYNRQITDTFERLSELFPSEATESHRSKLWDIAETAYHLADEVYSTEKQIYGPTISKSTRTLSRMTKRYSVPQ